MKAYTVVTSFAVAGLVGLAACASPGENGPTALKAPSSAQFLTIGEETDNHPELGVLKVCKTGNASGTFTLSRLQNGIPPLLDYFFDFDPEFTLELDVCRVVGLDNGGNGIWSILTLVETSGGLVGVSGEAIDIVNGNPVTTTLTIADFTAPITHSVNSFHGAVITFENFVEPPPPQVCDFITFGRLVTEVDGQKVVISGNAGGNKPGGGILGEFHIEANGVDNHVAEIDSYGPITSGPLSNLPNSRVVTGKAKNGVDVELRLWDGGEPGKGTDVVWVSLNGVVTIATKTIDQGNMQYHDVCRGPKD